MTIPADKKNITLGGVLRLLILPFLIGCQSLATIDNAAQSADPYAGGDYPSALARWTREARIYRGFDVNLIAAATFKSAPFRAAYADEYDRVFLLTETEKTKLMEDQAAAAELYLDFLLAAFVPEKKWNDFDKKDSVWKIALTTDGQRFIEAVEIRRIRKIDATINHFYPYVSPWKAVYRLRFPHVYPGTTEPIITDRTATVSLVLTGVQGTAEMEWRLNDSSP
jgi:hypothetical protein